MCIDMSYMGDRLFRVVILNSRARAVSLGELLATSKVLVQVIRTVLVQMDPWSESPTIEDLLSPLPQLDSVGTLDIAMPLRSPTSDIRRRLISEKLPSVEFLHVRDSILDIHGLASVAASLPSLATLAVHRPYFVLPDPQAAQDVNGSPGPLSSTLRSLEVHFREFARDGRCFDHAQALSRWLLAHPTSRIIRRSLTLTGDYNDPAPLLGQMLCEWATVDLHHLTLTLSASAGKYSSLR